MIRAVRSPKQWKTHAPHPTDGRVCSGISIWTAGQPPLTLCRAEKYALTLPVATNGQPVTCKRCLAMLKKKTKGGGA